VQPSNNHLATVKLIEFKRVDYAGLTFIPRLNMGAILGPSEILTTSQGAKVSINEFGDLSNPNAIFEYNIITQQRQTPVFGQAWERVSNNLWTPGSFNVRNIISFIKKGVLDLYPPAPIIPENLELRVIRVLPIVTRTSTQCIVSFNVEIGVFVKNSNTRIFKSLQGTVNAWTQLPVIGNSFGGQYGVIDKLGGLQGPIFIQDLFILSSDIRDLDNNEIYFPGQSAAGGDPYRFWDSPSAGLGLC
jgi:hypothetical protein